MSELNVGSVIREELGNIAPEADLAALDPKADMRKALDIDSLDVLNLITAIHKRLGVNVPEADYAKLVTLAGAIAYVEAALRKRTSK
jgi:acyl carrier protein